MPRMAQLYLSLAAQLAWCHALSAASAHLRQSQPLRGGYKMKDWFHAKNPDGYVEGAARDVPGALAAKDAVEPKIPGLEEDVVPDVGPKIPDLEQDAIPELRGALASKDAESNDLESEEGADRDEVKEDSAEEEAADGEDKGKKKKEAAEMSASKEKVNKNWMSFWYWQPLICGVGYMMAMTDAVGPLYNKFVAFSLQSEVVLLVATIFGFMAIVIFSASYSDEGKNAAGIILLMAYGTMGCTLTLLTAIGTIGLTIKGATTDDPIMEILTDVAKLFRMILRIVQVVIILTVITTEAKVDWSQLAMFMSFMMLGVALSLSGVIGDIMAHIFMRLDKHFKEGDYIEFEGDLVQITEFGWRHTTGVADSTQALIYIPNSMLTSAAIVNQSKDQDREVTIDIPIKLDADKTEQAIKNIWSLYAKTKEEGFTFTGADGEEYPNQFNTDSCDVWLNPSCDTIHLVLVGQYFFSKPPPEKEEEEDEEIEDVLSETSLEAAMNELSEDTQMDWEGPWNYQVTWFHLQVKKMNAELGAYPYIDSWGMEWNRVENGGRT